MTEAELFKDINCVACPQSPFINFSICLFCLQMDWLQPEPKRRQALFCSLMLFQSPVCCTKEAAWWHDECTSLICLRCCLSLSLIKGSGLWRCQRRRIQLCGLSGETSAERHSLEGDVLHCGANSPWGSSVRPSLLFTIYRISLYALNEPGYSASQRQRPRFHWRSCGFAELNNDN